MLAEAGRRVDAERHFQEAYARERWCQQQSDVTEAVLAGTTAPPVVEVGERDFRRINDDVGDLAPGAVETTDRSALTGDDRPRRSTGPAGTGGPAGCVRRWRCTRPTSSGGCRATRPAASSVLRIRAGATGSGS